MPRKVHVDISREQFLRCAQVFHDAMNKAQFDMGFKADQALAVALYTVGAYLKRLGWPLDTALVERGFRGVEQFGLLTPHETIKAMDKLRKPNVL